MTERCAARVWAYQGTSVQWHRCDRPAKGTRLMADTVWGRRSDEAPACGVHLRMKYAPEWVPYADTQEAREKA